MRASQKKDSEIPKCDLVFSGRKLEPKLAGLATTASVDLAVGKPGMFTLEMEGYDENQGSKWMESGAFNPGSTVEAQMGYRDNLANLFVGDVVGVDGSFSPDKPPRLTVRAYDHTHRLTRSEKRRAFTKIKYSDIARSIASEAGLTPRISDSRDVYEYVEQNGQSDLAFLLKLAGEIHFQLLLLGKQLVFEPVPTASNARIRMSFDDDLLEFHPNLSLARQASEVVVRGWDRSARSEITGRVGAGRETSKMGGATSASSLASKTFGNSVRLITDHPVRTQSEAARLAQARLDEMSLDLIEANGSARGRADLLPGTIIEIAGVSKWFSGRYYVTGTTHRYDFESGYTTKFVARRNAL